jgi:hypothetical protein
MDTITVEVTRVSVHEVDLSSDGVGMRAQCSCGYSERHLMSLREVFDLMEAHCAG